MINKELLEEFKLFSIFNELPFAMILLDFEGIIQAVNKAFIDIIPLTNQQFTGKKLEMIPGIHIDSKYLPVFFKEDTLNKNKKLEIKNQEGKSYLIEFIALDSIKQKRTYHLGIINKDKQEIELARELKKQLLLMESIEDELEHESELSEMKSKFLAIASHEFRTPLAGILSSLNLINRYIHADEQAWSRHRNRDKIVNHINKINESVKNLNIIINKSLAVDNIKKGEIPIKYDRFNLQHTLEKQVKQFQGICKRGQQISYEHKGKEKIVFLDKYLLRNIMNNMVSNAIKFSHKNSEIQIISSVVDDKINLIIKDNGIGIPKAELNKIFRRFYRANNALNYQEGTGLGLSIVKKYVELMNGNITFESTENIGTSFYITFPKKNNEEDFGY